MQASSGPKQRAAALQGCELCGAGYAVHATLYQLCGVGGSGVLSRGESYVVQAALEQWTSPMGDKTACVQASFGVPAQLRAPQLAIAALA